MVDAGWQIARTLPSENRQRRRTLGIADMCGAGFRRIRPSGSTCGVVVRKKEDRVPLDLLFAEHSRVLAQDGIDILRSTGTPSWTRQQGNSRARSASSRIGPEGLNLTAPQR